MRCRRLLASAAAVLTLAALVDVATAAAAYDPVASGLTRLTLARSFVGLMRAHGVTLRATDGVTVNGAAVDFPVEGGKLEPVEAKGVVEHSGSLVFRAGAHSLPLRALQLKTTRQSAPYVAKLGGGQLKIATTYGLRSERVGFGSRFKVSGLLLTAGTAERLDKKLGLPGVFYAGQQLGTATTTVDPASVGIAPTGAVELSIDPAFAAKLAGVFVAVNPIAPAEHPGAFTMPIGGGVLPLVPGVPAGGLKTRGAIEFIQIGGGQYFARELEFDVTDSVANGESQLILASSGPGPNQGGAIFSLGAGATTTSLSRSITVTGATLGLEPSTAQALNEAFALPLHKADLFAAGEVLGTVNFNASAE